MFTFTSDDSEGWYDKLRRFKREIIYYYLEKNSFIKLRAANQLNVNKRVMLFIMNKDDILKKYIKEPVNKKMTIYDRKDLWKSGKKDP